MKPSLVLLAGPNGAGKSTLFETRVRGSFFGPFINADLIQRDELRDPSHEASYAAAKIADLRRAEMFANGRSFVTETVFSHPSKLDLIEKARGLGYNVIVMQVGVESADLSVARVKERSDEGGHDVPEDKIRARFDRCLPLIREAVHIADVGQVFDNSTLGKPPRRVVTFSKGLLVFVDPELPRWVLDVYAADLSLLRRDT